MIDNRGSGNNREGITEEGNIIEIDNRGGANNREGWLLYVLFNDPHLLFHVPTGLSNY